MSTDAAFPGRWSRGRWLGFIALMCALQIILLFWLGDATPSPAGAQGPAPTLRLAGSGDADRLALMDPTLFALPHRQSFSGPGWLVVLPQKFEPYVWSNPPDWLELPLTDLGAAFQRFVETNVVPLSHILPQPEPELTWPELAATRYLPPASTLKLAGDLSRRRLLSPLTLPPWPNPELLTNSVVRLVVDAAGVPISQTLLTGSGSKEADQYALAQARAVRFEPVANQGTRSAPAGMSWGELIFEWHTTPLLTNATPAGQ